MSTYSVIGKRTPRVDGGVKAIGDAKYAADLVQPRMLWGKMLTSPHAHARILNIDTSRAEALPGVMAVATGKDLAGFKHGFLPTTRDECILAEDRVRFVGDAVASVAAVDEETAAEALSLIDVEYEPLPIILDPEEAMKPGAIEIHPGIKNNVSFEYHYHFGDVERGFAESDYVREDTFKSPQLTHGFLEPYACLGIYDPTGKITLWTAKQAPFFVHRVLALAFNMPQNKVRVIQPYIGAGFGGKAEPFPLDVCSVLLSRKAGGRPVKIVYSQKETLTQGRHRTPVIVKLKTGVKKDGTLVARQLTALLDSGAYTAGGPLTTYLIGHYLTMPYKLSHAKYDGYRAYTNHPASNPHRGHGFCHIVLAGECQMNMIAEELGINPVDIRLKNIIPPNYTTINGIKVQSCGLKECIEKAAEASHFKEKWCKKRQDGNIARGIGFAIGSFCSGMKMPMHPSCAAYIMLEVDGTVHLGTGATDIGQGSDTVLSQIAAEELGVRVEDIHLAHIDSDFTPVDAGSISSRVTLCAGAAVKAAAEDARRQLAELAAESLKTDPKTIEFKDGRAFISGTPERGMEIRRLTRMAQVLGRTVIGRGVGNLNCEMADFAHDYGNHTPAYAFFAQAVETEVDVETGRVKATDSWLSNDCGTVLNPLAVEAQHQGCIYMGQSQTVSEELKYDESGNLLNPNFAEYKMLRAPDVFKMHISQVETYEPNAPYGAKEAGEGPIITTYPAIVSGVYDAVGIWTKELPVTPEKILRAIKEKKGK